VVVLPARRIPANPPPVSGAAFRPSCPVDRLRSAYGLDAVQRPLVDLLA
jgi:hypothetical protein